MCSFDAQIHVLTWTYTLDIRACIILYVYMYGSNSTNMYDCIFQYISVAGFWHGRIRGMFEQEDLGPCTRYGRLNAVEAAKNRLSITCSQSTKNTSFKPTRKLLLYTQYATLYLHLLVKVIVDMPAWLSRVYQTSTTAVCLVKMDVLECWFLFNEWVRGNSFMY